MRRRAFSTTLFFSSMRAKAISDMVTSAPSSAQSCRNGRWLPLHASAGQCPSTRELTAKRMRVLLREDMFHGSAADATWINDTAQATETVSICLCIFNVDCTAPLPCQWSKYELAMQPLCKDLVPILVVLRPFLRNTSGASGVGFPCGDDQF